MGVYIKGMEMPKSCYACMFFSQSNHWNRNDEADILSYCKRTGEKTWENVNGYLPNCPLVPVPPHGRIGDLDRLAKEVEDMGKEFPPDSIGAERYRLFAEFIKTAPTITPADPVEEDKKMPLPKAYVDKEAFSRRLSELIRALEPCPDKYDAAVLVKSVFDSFPYTTIPAEEGEI